MAKFETVPLAELKYRLPGKLMPVVEEYKEKLGKLGADQGGRLTIEKGDDPKDLRKALKAAAGALIRRIRFPFRGEEGSLSFYLEKATGPQAEGRGTSRPPTTGEAEEGRIGGGGDDRDAVQVALPRMAGGTPQKAAEENQQWVEMKTPGEPRWAFLS